MRFLADIWEDTQINMSLIPILEVVNFVSPAKLNPVLLRPNFANSKPLACLFALKPSIYVRSRFPKLQTYRIGSSASLSLRTPNFLHYQDPTGGPHQMRWSHAALIYLDSFGELIGFLGCIYTLCPASAFMEYECVDRLNRFRRWDPECHIHT
jgi:hypothetical protein